MLLNEEGRKRPTSYAMYQTQVIDNQEAKQRPLQKLHMFYKLVILLRIRCGDIPKKSDKCLFLLRDSAVLIDPV